MLLTAATSQAADPPLTVHEAKAREIYAKSISIPTQLGNAKMKEFAEYLAGEFRAAGFPSEDIHILPFKGEGDETVSLVVRYRSDGKGGNGSGAKPILLMAHMDVVTANRSEWERDPYTLIEENGFFYGRGTYDVKQGTTALTATFLRLKAEKFVPTRDLIIYFSGDEETEMGTVRDVVQNHRALVDAEYALNSDGGGGALDDDTGKALFYGLQTAEKTYADYYVTARNAGGHSSQPRDDNAIYELAAALTKVRAHKFPVQWNDTTIASFAQAGITQPGALGKALAAFAAKPGDPVAAAVIEKDVSFNGQLRTTCVATMLTGGHAENALPQTARANVNCRIFPGVSIEDVQSKLQEIVGKSAEVSLVRPSLSSDASPLRKDVMQAVTRAIHKIQPGVPVVPSQASGATDGLVLRAAGIPTYGVDGNFIRPKDEFAHGLNERLPVKSFYDSLTYWHALLKDLAGKRGR
ncbi:MAG: M20/M25/M40 family metallo-hydrolase [Steroidobacteraceae bacterium]|nr:M20/M25/M40 family metallo-hydrolase [Steroidobacteraceae bacterium]